MVLPGTLKAMANSTLLRRGDACQRLGIKPSYYRLLVSRGELREIAIGKRARRLPDSEIERFIAERVKERREQ
jgi:excisionase family DNA binding protein